MGKIRRNMTCKNGIIYFTLGVFIVINTIVLNVVNVEAVRNIVDSILTYNNNKLNYVLFFVCGPLFLVEVLLRFAINKNIFILRKSIFIEMEDRLIKNFAQSDIWEKQKDFFSIIINDIPQFVDLHCSLYVSIFTSISALFGGVIYSLSIDWVSTLICIFMHFFVFYFLKEQLTNLPNIEKKLGEKHNRNYTYIWNIFENFEIDSYLKNQKIMKSYKYTLKEILENVTEKSKILAKISLAKNIANTGVLLIIAVVIAICSYLGISNIDMADALALFIVIPKISKVLESLLTISAEKKKYEGVKKRIKDASSYTSYNIENKMNINNINNIKFDNLSFSYGNNEIFNKLSFRLSAGDFVMVSGESGRGKSTLFKILLGLLSDYRGQILLDDIELKLINRNSLWKLCSYIQQGSILLEQTVRENIVLNHAYNWKKLDEILGIVGLKEVIMKLPLKENSLLSDIGLSSGEQQKLVIARALYKPNIRLIVLDEATSSLDNRAEKEILYMLKRITKEKRIICLFVSHNEGLKEHADYILDL